MDSDSQIKGQNELIEMLKKELDGRTQWALSLEAEVAKERAHSKEAHEKLQENTEEVLRIRREFASSLIYRVLAKMKIIPSVWGK